MIEFQFEEAREIVRTAVARDGRSNFDDFPADMQAQAIVGVVAMMRVAQELGYKIERPENSIYK